MHSSNPELLHSCLIGKSAYSFKKASIKKFLPAAILDSFTLPAEVRLFFPSPSRNKTATPGMSLPVADEAECH